MNSHFKTRYFSYNRTLPGYTKNRLVKLLSPVLRTSFVQNKTNNKRTYRCFQHHTRLSVVRGRIRNSNVTWSRGFYCGEWSQAARLMCAETVKYRKKNLEMMSFYEKYSVFTPALCFEYNTTARMIRSKRNCHLIPL